MRIVSDWNIAIGKLIRENVVLAVGISLPALVVFFFLLATYVPRWLVDAPQYDFLFTQDHSHRDDKARWRYRVNLEESGELQIRATPVKADVYAGQSRLFLFQHESDDVLVELPEFSDTIIDSHRVAPDGYELIDQSGRQGQLVGLFYRGNRDDLAIGKNGQ